MNMLHRSSCVLSLVLIAGCGGGSSSNGGSASTPPSDDPTSTAGDTTAGTTGGDTAAGTTDGDTSTGGGTGGTTSTGGGTGGTTSTGGGTDGTTSTGGGTDGTASTGGGDTDGGNSGNEAESATFLGRPYTDVRVFATAVLDGDLLDVWRARISALASNTDPSDRNEPGVRALDCGDDGEGEVTVTVGSEASAAYSFSDCTVDGVVLNGSYSILDEVPNSSGTFRITKTETYGLDVDDGNTVNFVGTVIDITDNDRSVPPDCDGLQISERRMQLERVAFGADPNDVVLLDLNTSRRNTEVIIRLDQDECTKRQGTLFTDSGRAYSGDFDQAFTLARTGGLIDADASEITTLTEFEDGSNAVLDVRVEETEEQYMRITALPDARDRVQVDIVEQNGARSFQDSWNFSP